MNRLEKSPIIGALTLIEQTSTSSHKSDSARQLHCSSLLPEEAGRLVLTTSPSSFLLDPALKLMFFVDVQNNTVEGSLKVEGNS